MNHKNESFQSIFIYFVYLHPVLYILCLILPGAGKTSRDIETSINKLSCTTSWMQVKHLTCRRLWHVTRPVFMNENGRNCCLLSIFLVTHFIYTKCTSYELASHITRRL